MPGTKLARALLLPAIVFVGTNCGAAAAPPAPMPGGWQASNVRPVAYIAVKDRPRAFKMSMKKVGERWYLFVAGGSFRASSSGFDVFDVTDPATPRQVASVDVPGGNGQLTIGADLLIVAQQAPITPAASEEHMFAGVTPEVRSLATIFDISDPVHPRRLSEWKVDGLGSHRNVYPGGRYAYMAAWKKGFKGQATLSILDLADPAHPIQIGEWWQTGQREGEPDRPPPNGYHGPANVSADGRTLTLGYTPSFVNLDISDPAHPRLIGKLDIAPLPEVGAQAIHTVLPLPGPMAYLSTEASGPGCDKESISYAAVIDNRDPAKPVMVAHFPKPVPPPGAPYRSFCDADGRAGPHNVNGESHLPYLQKPGPLIYMAAFVAGLRVYDISNPYDPRETGWFLPKTGTWKSGARGLEDVIVDQRGYAYVSNGTERGVWVVRYTGPTPGTTKPPRR